MTDGKRNAAGVWDALAQGWRKLRQTGKAGGLLVLGLCGVVLLAWGNLWSTPASTPGAAAPARTRGTAGGRDASGPQTAGEPVGGQDYARQLERSLAETLSQVAGAGQVSVRVFLGSGPRYEYARRTTGDTRTTQETDRGGTSHVTSEQHEEGEVTVMRGAGGGEDQPVVVVTHLPEVDGVLIVASGAGDPEVRAELTLAVETALHLPAHRVRVLTKEGGE